ncbi:MAG TPA: trypsin-like peptidase domain-containing protein [Pyrinomonadaceae bacterium]|jgi:hypothetical protein
MRKRLLLACLLLALAAQALSAQTAAPLTSEQIAERSSASVVLILTGMGGGRLEKAGTGLIVRPDGVILTAYHLIKDAREVQVRLKNGEAYDKVQLIASDERRDVAALRISATNLPLLPIGETDNAPVGERVYAISNPKLLAWTASDGILSAIRLADDVPGAGSGYRLLQFTAPVSEGSSGGVLIDDRGSALGLIVASAGGQNLNFAVPLNSVMGLANAGGGSPLGDGGALSLPQPVRPPNSAAIAKADPAEMLRTAQTIFITSNTSYFESVQLQNALSKRTEFTAWKLLVVDGWEAGKLADILIEVDRPIFTYTLTYKIKDQKTSVILATGKVTAFDGNLAAPELAREIIKRLKAVRPLPAAPETKEAQKK